MLHVNSILYTISKLTIAVRDILIALGFSVFKISNLFLKLNVYIFNIEVFCSTVFLSLKTSFGTDPWKWSHRKKAQSWLEKNTRMTREKSKY